MNQTDVLIVREVEDALNEALCKRGRVNVLIAGQTGVGKSTLINAVFQGQLATTGQGKPVTQNTREITKEGVPLSIFDTRGLEMKDFQETLQPLEDLILHYRRDPDAQRHIHIAWVCLTEDSRRVQEGEVMLVDMLAKHVPVIVIITKARADEGFRSKVQELLPKARNVVRIRAIAEQLDEGFVLPPMGLIELIDLTMQVVPEAQRNAFVAAQRVDIELKRKRSHEAVIAAATTAAAAGATPIPFADAALLVPIQVGMLARITAVFGISLSKGFLLALLGSVLGGTGATLIGRAVVSNILKLLPGAGTAAGATISAITASALTTAFGEAYIATLSALFHETRGEPPSDDEIIERFRKEFAKKQSGKTEE
jgi:uncharacterized protein (DUF697 family)/GTP-binding protein EngB required for normal cell division